jgi:hypothetical protein
MMACMKNTKWLMLVAILMLSACAHIGEQKSREYLEAQQKLFMEAMRWKSYDVAASVIRFKNPARKLASIERMNKITVTSYDLVASIANFKKELRWRRFYSAIFKTI